MRSSIPSPLFLLMEALIRPVSALYCRLRYEVWSLWDLDMPGEPTEVLPPTDRNREAHERFLRRRGLWP